MLTTEADALCAAERKPSSVCRARIAPASDTPPADSCRGAGTGPKAFQAISTPATTVTVCASSIHNRRATLGRVIMFPGSNLEKRIVSRPVLIPRRRRQKTRLAFDATIAARVTEGKLLDVFPSGAH